MRVPDEVRDTCVFICSRHNGFYSLRGTGFFVAWGADPPAIYLVTAAHVIDGIRSLRDQGRGDGHIFVRLNRVGKDSIFYQIGDELDPAPDEDVWARHPSADEKVDVAAVSWMEAPDALDYKVIPPEMFLTDEKRSTLTSILGPGTDVFMTGLFVNHVGQNRNEPIIRTGSIASMPSDPIRSSNGMMEGFLIEARSIGGLSGSPVFADVPLPTAAVNKYSGALTTGMFYFLGLMHGHWDVQLDDRQGEAVNMGIGIVVPAMKIVEVLDGERLKELRDKERSDDVDPHRAR